MDAEMEARGEKLNVNLTLQPLISLKGQRVGSLLMIENISNEKRMKSTMARYMDPGLADKLLAGGGEQVVDGVDGQRFEGALASLKATFDGLVDAGLLHDDSALTHLPLVFLVDAKNPRVELLLKRWDKQ